MLPRLGQALAWLFTGLPDPYVLAGAVIVLIFLIALR